MPAGEAASAIASSNSFQLTLLLFAAGEAHPKGEGAALPASEGAKVRSVLIVNHSIWIVAAKDVYDFQAYGPGITAKLKFLFDSEIET